MFLLPIERNNPTRFFPLVTLLLCASNIVVFILTTYVFNWKDMFRAFGFDPVLASWGTLLSSMFMHGGIAHIAGNMIFLAMFGDNVEDVLGPPLFLLSYLLCGVAGTVFYYFFNTTSPYPLIGASGAISGVMGMYAMLFPFSYVDVVVHVRESRLGVIHVAGLTATFIWMVEQIGLGAFSRISGFEKFIATAFSAHVGGLLSGVCLGLMFSFLGYKASAPDKVLRFWRKKKDTVWCPHCGKEEPGKWFGTFQCSECGTQYELLNELQREEQTTKFDSNSAEYQNLLIKYRQKSTDALRQIMATKPQETYTDRAYHVVETILKEREPSP